MTNPRRSLTCIGAFAALAIATAASATAQITITPKHWNAPPEEFLDGPLSAPDFKSAAHVSNYAMIDLEFTRDADGAWRSITEIPSGSSRTARLLILSPQADAFELSLRTPGLTPIELRDGLRHAHAGAERGPIHLGHYSTTGTLYLFTDLPRGAWTLEAGLPAAERAAAAPRAKAIIKYDTGDRLRTHAAHYNLVVGNRAVYEAEAPAGRVTSATLTVTDASGESRTTSFSRTKTPRASFDIQRTGQHAVTIRFEGVDREGDPYIRTTHHVFRAAERAFDLTQRASAVVQGANLDVRIAIEGLERDDRCIASSQLWGRDRKSGADVPIAWLGGMTAPLADSGELPLTLDPRWIALASATGPYELRETRIVCPQTNTILAERETIALDLNERALSVEAPREITPDMQTLRPASGLQLEIPSLGAPLATSRAAGAHNLLFSHGYCAGGNPWPPGDFTGPSEALNDPDANRTQDEFALLLAAVGDNGKSFGIVGHSQGGLAALHLFTFYYSGMDWAEGNRLIQSVGSPYQGTPLAGAAAGIGGIFGAGCGQNSDLDPSGALVWLSTIPMAPRANVYYWTTSNSGSGCNFFSGLFLSDPEDGVIEQVRGQLPGANNMGHTVGWCHTTGMSNPAQYLDATRNAEMNTNAAR